MKLGRIQNLFYSKKDAFFLARKTYLNFYPSSHTFSETFQFTSCQIHFFVDIFKLIRRYDLGIFAWDSLTPDQRQRRRNLIGQFRRCSPDQLFSNWSKYHPFDLFRWKKRKRKNFSIVVTERARREMSDQVKFFLNFKFFCRKSQRTRRDREGAGHQNERTSQCLQTRRILRAQRIVSLSSEPVFRAQQKKKQNTLPFTDSLSCCKQLS